MHGIHHPWAARTLCRLLLHWMGGVVCQLRYSFVWLLSEASLTFMGLNLKGWDEKGRPIWWVNHIQLCVCCKMLFSLKSSFG